MQFFIKVDLKDKIYRSSLKVHLKNFSFNPNAMMQIDLAPPLSLRLTCSLNLKEDILL